MGKQNIRLAIRNDLDIIVGIYNQAVRAGNATADLEEVSVESKEEWFAEHDNNKYPIYILNDGHKTIGWGSLSPYRKGRAALQATAEISYYLDYTEHGQGHGKYLIEYMLKDCQRLGIKNLFALLLEVNRSSVKILEHFGFEQWGHMPHVAELNGTSCGHLIYGKNL